MISYIAKETYLLLILTSSISQQSHDVSLELPYIPTTAAAAVIATADTASIYY